MPELFHIILFNMESESFGNKDDGHYWVKNEKKVGSAWRQNFQRWYGHTSALLSAFCRIEEKFKFDFQKTLAYLLKLKIWNSQ